MRIMAVVVIHIKNHISVMTVIVDIVFGREFKTGIEIIIVSRLDIEIIGAIK